MTNEPIAIPVVEPIEVTAQCTDRRQSVTVEDGCVVRVRGTAVNSGALPSRLTLEFNGRSLIVPLGVGMSPHTTYQAVRRALTRRYRVDLLSSTITPGGEVSFCIKRKSDIERASGASSSA